MKLHESNVILIWTTNDSSSASMLQVLGPVFVCMYYQVRVKYV